MSKENKYTCIPDGGKLPNYSNTECVTIISPASHTYTTDGRFIYTSGVKYGTIQGVISKLSDDLEPELLIKCRTISKTSYFFIHINMDKNPELTALLKSKFKINEHS